MPKGPVVYFMTRETLTLTSAGKSMLTLVSGSGHSSYHQPELASLLGQSIQSSCQLIPLSVQSIQTDLASQKLPGSSGRELEQNTAEQIPAIAS